MIRGEPGDRLEHLLDVVVSWPGITVEQAAREVGVMPHTVRGYAARCRRLGWLRRGAVPRTVDIGAMTIADWRAADGMVTARVHELYRVVCSRYDLGLPCDLRDIGPHGFRLSEAHTALKRLRLVDAIHPVNSMWPTDAGELLAAVRLDPDALLEQAAG